MLNYLSQSINTRIFNGHKSRASEGLLKDKTSVKQLTGRNVLRYSKEDHTAQIDRINIINVDGLVGTITYLLRSLWTDTWFTRKYSASSTWRFVKYILTGNVGRTMDRCTLIISFSFHPKLFVSPPDFIRSLNSSKRFANA